MRRSFAKRCAFLLIVITLSLAGSGCKTAKTVTDTLMQSDLVGTVGQMVGNETLAAFTTENINALGEGIVTYADSVQNVAPPEHPYSRRLDTLAAELAGTRALSGHALNFEVYLADTTINAFATPDGSIRIFSGLMNKLDDGELRFVLAHEAGHVVKGHSREKLMVAVGIGAVRDLAAKQGGTLEDLATGRAGEVTAGVAKAQFSQKEENEADDFALAFMADQGYDIRKAPSALIELVPPAGADTSQTPALLASHPAPKARAARLREQLRTNEEYAALVKYHAKLDEQEPAPSRKDAPEESEALEKDDVAALQKQLNARGYDCGVVDGVMGSNTRRCIRAFQRANGLQPSGEMNRATRKMLRQTVREKSGVE